MKKSEPNSLERRLDEALGDKPSNQIDARAALKSLARAIASLSLSEKLNANGVKWYASNSNGNVISFFVNKSPAFQVLSSDLTKPDTFAATLRKIRSLSNGKSPDSDDIEFSLLEKQYKDTKDDRKGLEETARKIIESSNGALEDVDDKPAG